MQTLLQDLRYAVRAAWGDRAVSCIAVLTLALGIGANTALFTVAHAVLLAPLPFQDADRLVRITGDFAGQNVKDIGLSIPELFDFRDRAEIFDSLAGVWPISANLTETAEPERVETALVDANYFALLGVTAQIGRVFGPSDAPKGIGEGAVISDAIWRRRFGADPTVIGRRCRGSRGRPGRYPRHQHAALRDQSTRSRDVPRAVSHPRRHGARDDVPPRPPRDKSRSNGRVAF